MNYGADVLDIVIYILHKGCILLNIYAILWFTLKIGTFECANVYSRNTPCVFIDNLKQQVRISTYILDNGNINHVFKISVYS